jgi:hypothetical protein
MSIPQPPTRVHCGVTIPDTPLITAAIDYARKYSSDAVYNHVLRSFLFGFIITDKIHPPSKEPRDTEAHAIAAILHDIGFPLGHPPHGDIISKDKRFEVDGAHAARNFILQVSDPSIGGGNANWDKHRAQLVWDAIALHTIGSVVFEKELEVRGCSYGIWADFQGPDRVPSGLLTWDEYKAVVTEYPRLGLMKELKDNMCALCETKPETTYDNTVGEWGDRYVEGYSRKGKLTQDLLETCDLDDKAL